MTSGASPLHLYRNPFTPLHSAPRPLPDLALATINQLPYKYKLECAGLFRSITHFFRLPTYLPTQPARRPRTFQVKQLAAAARNGACLVVAAAGAASGGRVRGRARRSPGALLLRVRGLAGRQREQQRHRVAGAGQLPAIRRRLPRRRHRPLQQRSHHRRRHLSASGLRRLHPSVRGRKQRSTPLRRQLCLRCRRNQGRDRPATGSAHKLRRAAPELPGGGAAAGEHPGGRGLGGEPPEPVHLHGGHGQQRLPQQLLHARRLPHQPPVHPGAVRRRALQPVRAAAQDPVQQRSQEGGADGRGAGGVQPQRAGAAELRRRHLRGADQQRHRDLQPEAGGDGGSVQRDAGGTLHLHQRLRDLPGHHQVAGGQRSVGAEQGVLRGGEEQRAGDVPALPDAVRQQERVPLLGRLPPNGGGQHPRREEGIQSRRPLRRPPRRPADACSALVLFSCGWLWSDQWEGIQVACFVTSVHTASKAIRTCASELLYFYSYNFRFCYCN